MTPARQQFSLIWRLLGRKIFFHASFVPLTNSATAALMLSQALYWTRREIAANPNQRGWFIKTSAEWTAETGLSRREQDTARRKLESLHLLGSQVQGMPARMHYRLDPDAIVDAFHFSGQVDWQDEQSIFTLLGRPIVFQRDFVDVTGSVTAALMLSHAISLTSRILDTRPDGWFWKMQSDWTTETGLSRCEQETARRKLREMGLLEEKRSLQRTTGLALNYFRIPLSALEDAMRSLETSQTSGANSAPLQCYNPPNKRGDIRQTVVLKPAKQVGRYSTRCNATTSQTSGANSAPLQCHNQPNKRGEFPPTAMPQPAKQQCGDPPNSNVVTRQSSLHESDNSVCTNPALPYKGAKIVSEKKQQQLPATPDLADGGRCELHFPRQLLPETHGEIAKRLSVVNPDVAQQILDVMAHAFQQPKGVSSPAGLLRRLIASVATGDFDPLPGYAIAQGRIRQAQLAQHAVAASPQGKESRSTNSIPPDVDKFLDQFRTKHPVP